MLPEMEKASVLFPNHLYYQTEEKPPGKGVSTMKLVGFLEALMREINHPLFTRFTQMPSAPAVQLGSNSRMNRKM